LAVARVPALQCVRIPTSLPSLLSSLMRPKPISPILRLISISSVLISSASSNSIFLIQTKDKGIIAVKEIQKINDNWVGHIQPLENLIKDSFSFRSILNLYGDRDRIEKIYKEKEEYFIIFPNKEIYGLSLEEVKNQLDIKKIDFIDMNKYMNKNGEEKSLTIRYQIYLDKLSNYNYYNKEFEISEIKKVFIFKGIIIVLLILTFFIISITTYFVFSC